VLRLSTPRALDSRACRALSEPPNAPLPMELPPDMACTSGAGREMPGTEPTCTPALDPGEIVEERPISVEVPGAVELRPTPVGVPGAVEPRPISVEVPGAVEPRPTPAEVPGAVEPRPTPVEIPGTVSVWPPSVRPPGALETVPGRTSRGGAGVDGAASRVLRTVSEPNPRSALPLTATAARTGPCQ
jgi:hypothetical protein